MMNSLFKKPEGKTTVERILCKDTYYAPEININFSALLKMKAYVENCDVEIAWLGLVEYDENKNSYTVIDVELIEQEVSSVNADMMEKGLQKYAQSLIAKGEADKLSKIKCWGHSHVKMGVSPSQIDADTYEQFYKNCDYFIRIIANKSGDMKIDIIDTIAELQFNNIDWKAIIPTELLEANQELSVITKQYEAAQTKLNSFVDIKYNEIVNDIKKEITTNVTKDTTSNYTKTKDKKYGKKTQNTYDPYTYDPYGDTRTYMNNTYNIKIWDEDFKGVQKYIYEPLEEVLTLNEIVYIAETDLDYKEIDEMFTHLTMFKYYTNKDWDTLKDICGDYYTEEFYEGIGAYGY